MNSMRTLWVPTLDESELREDTMYLVSPKGVSIIIIRKDGHVYALRNRCAHMSCTLAGGRLNGDTLQCPCHEWKYDITTGEFLEAREITVPTYRCKFEDGKLLVELEER
jgi:nitrite reductase/ring-hydroxylating ferredoxin subunit